jgi:hypothetical protein
MQKTGLESDILRDRIRNRGLLSENPTADPLAIAAALSNESFNPESVVNANERAKAARTLTDPSAPLAARGRAAAARGDSLTDSLVNAIEGRAPPIEVPKTFTSADGAVNTWVRDTDPNNPVGYRPLLVTPGTPPERPGKTLMPGGSYLEKQDDGSWQEVVAKGPAIRPVTDAQLADQKSRADRVALGSGFTGIQDYVNMTLGARTPDGAPTNKPELNPFEMASVVEDANRISQMGYSMIAAINHSLRRHGLSQANLKVGEFEGDQENTNWKLLPSWLNPTMGVEADAAGVGLPVPASGQGDFLRGADTTFFDRTDPKDYSKNVVRSSFVRGEDVPVPLRIVGRLTNLGDDIGTAVADPRFATPLIKNGRRVPIEDGVMYYMPSQSGGTTFGIGRRKPNGEMAFIPDEG